MKELNNKELELIRKGLYELQRKVYKELEESNYKQKNFTKWLKKQKKKERVNKMEEIIQMIIDIMNDNQEEK